MKKFEYKVVPIATSIAIGTKGYFETWKKN